MILSSKVSLNFLIQYIAPSLPTGKSLYFTYLLHFYHAKSLEFLFCEVPFSEYQAIFLKFIRKILLWVVTIIHYLSQNKYKIFGFLCFLPSYKLDICSLLINCIVYLMKDTEY